ncbi:MAG: DUF4091 domain-containing protein [Fimbriimonadaceae bacterium]|nr:DUF4091 domain-containing protein [Fimbriimonadaceae bacterium]
MSVARFWNPGPWQHVVAGSPEWTGDVELACNEQRSVQLAVELTAPLPAAELRLSGDLAALDWRLHRVGRVQTKEAGAVADQLHPWLGSADLAAGLQPCWLIVRSAAPGLFSGCVELWSAGAVVAALPLTVRVDPVRLPDPTDWAFYLDLWQQPTALADELGLPRWSDAHFHALQPYLRDLARAGQKPLTCTILDEPWGHQTHYDFPSMVRWQRRGEGWGWDFAVFDRYVELATVCGLRGPISCYSLVLGPGDRTDCVFLGEGGEREVCEVGDEVYRRTWSAFLRCFRDHLDRRGWLSRTQLGFDEKPPAVMAAALGLVREVTPELRCALAGNWMPEHDAGIADYCVIYPGPPPEACAARRDRGVTTTFYTCCGPAFPNTFPFSPPLESTLLPWIAAALGADGYLRWAYASWPADALACSDFGPWPSGDTFLVYRGPDGPLSTPRYEMLLEGVQDYELVRLAAATGSPQVATAVALGQRQHDGRVKDGRDLEQARRWLRAVVAAGQ